MPSISGTLEPEEHVPLSPLCTLGVGGAARWFTRAAFPESIDLAHAWAAERGVPLFVLGGGSNLVIADGGLDALVVQIGISGVAVRRDGDEVLLTAGGGESWDAFVSGAVARGLAGVECLSGIPGTVGGTPVQNVGAYGQEVGHVIDSLSAYDRRDRQLVGLKGLECGFSYRHSRFKTEDAGRFVICDVTFRLREGPPTLTYPDLIDHVRASGQTAPDLLSTRQAVLAVRRRKGMVVDARDPDTRSVGSFFMNPVVEQSTYDLLAASAGHARVPYFVMEGGGVKIPAAWLIERAGFSKGHSEGRVGLSSKHPLALINRGGATARDVVAFAARIKRRVLDTFHISLRIEPVCVGFTADPLVDFLAG